MTAKAQRPATYEDVLAAPANVVAEILFGVLHTHPRPASKHAVASARIGMEVGSLFDRGRGGPGGWIILDEPELHFGADIVVPDLAGWKRDRISAKDLEGAFVTVTPNWICEVLSPGTEALDRGDKMTIYGREGVDHAWLVDPLEKTLEVYVLEQTQWRRKDIFRGEVSARAEPFDAIELDLNVFWKP